VVAAVVTAVLTESGIYSDAAVQKVEQ